MNFWERDEFTYKNMGQSKTSNLQNDGDSAQASGTGQSSCAKSFEEAYDHYSHQSEDELMSQLLRVASQMKGNGTFDAQALENLYENSKGYLSPQQLAKMRSLINMLKGDGNGAF